MNIFMKSLWAVKNVCYISFLPYTLNLQCLYERFIYVKPHLLYGLIAAALTLLSLRNKHFHLVFLRLQPILSNMLLARVKLSRVVLNLSTPVCSISSFFRSFKLRKTQLCVNDAFLLLLSLQSFACLVSGWSASKNAVHLKYNLLCMVLNE